MPSNFRWGGGREDKYFARIGKNVVSVYETETFTLIDKKSLKVENVMDFTWSPTDPMIALFVPELGGGNQPARVVWRFFSCLWFPCNSVNLRNSFLSTGEPCSDSWQRRTKTEKSF